MTDEPTELDRRRSAYADQLIAHVENVAGNRDEDVRFLVDNLLLEWGAAAYRQGRHDMAADIVKYANQFMREIQ